MNHGRTVLPSPSAKPYNHIDKGTLKQIKEKENET